MKIRPYGLRPGFKKSVGMLSTLKNKKRKRDGGEKSLVNESMNIRNINAIDRPMGWNYLLSKNLISNKIFAVKSVMLNESL